MVGRLCLVSQGCSIGDKLLRSLYALDRHCPGCHGPWINSRTSGKVSSDHFAAAHVAFAQERVSGFMEALVLPGQMASLWLLVCSWNYPGEPGGLLSMGLHRVKHD